MHKWLLLASVLLGGTVLLRADEVYQAPEAFLAEIFAGTVPEKEYVWLKGGLRDRVSAILGHRYRQLRVTYWREGARTAWILEEIGKVKPITVGLVIGPEGLEVMRVLVYRESYGWEIRYPFFTGQFDGLRLEENDRLSDSIDGISGATLSVNAVTRLARMALVLHETVGSADTNLAESRG